jgi:hypothetical protein
MTRHKAPGPTTECTVSRAPIEERLVQTFNDRTEQSVLQRREASRRDSPVTCVACGKRVGRRGRKQKYCSRRCRQRDYWDRRALAKISAVVTHHSAHSTTPYKLSSKFNGLQRLKSRRLSFGEAPLNLLGGGEWRWPGITQLDATTRAKIVCAEIGDTSAGRMPTYRIPEVYQKTKHDPTGSSASNPFDPASLDQNYAERVGVKKLLTTVPVRKPNRQDFVRVHPVLHDFSNSKGMSWLTALCACIGRKWLFAALANLSRAPP